MKRLIEWIPFSTIRSILSHSALKRFAVKVLVVLTPIVVVPVASRFWTDVELADFVYLNSLFPTFLLLVSLNYHSAFRKIMVNSPTLWGEAWVLPTSLSLFLGLYVLVMGLGLIAGVQDLLGIPLQSFVLLFSAAMVIASYNLIETYFIVTERHKHYSVFAFTFLAGAPVFTLLLVYFGAGGDARLQSQIFVAAIFAAITFLVFQPRIPPLAQMKYWWRKGAPWVADNFKSGLSLAPLVFLETAAITIDKIFVRNTYDIDVSVQYMILAQYAMLIQLVAQVSMYVFQAETHKVKTVQSKVLSLILVSLAIFSLGLYFVRIPLLDFYLNYTSSIDETLLGLLIIYYFQRGIINYLSIRLFIADKHRIVTALLYPIYAVFIISAFIFEFNIHYLCVGFNVIAGIQIAISSVAIRGRS